MTPSLLSRGAWIEILGSSGSSKFSESLLSRGAWIEITAMSYADIARKSLLSRGAWIEIKPTPTPWARNIPSLLSRGAWIEITLTPRGAAIMPRRSSHEERGLK